MRFPIVLAHGQGALLIANLMVAVANLAAFASLALAVVKKSDRVSRAGIACAAFGILLGGLILSWGFPTDLSLFTVALVAPVPISLCGGLLSLRRAGDG